MKALMSPAYAKLKGVPKVETEDDAKNVLGSSRWSCLSLANSWISSRQLWLTRGSKHSSGKSFAMSTSTIIKANPSNREFLAELWPVDDMKQSVTGERLGGMYRKLR